MKNHTKISQALDTLRENTSIRGYCNIVKEYLYNEMQIEVTENRIYKVVGGHVVDTDIEKALWIYINSTASSLHEKQQAKGSNLQAILQESTAIVEKYVQK